MTLDEILVMVLDFTVVVKTETGLLGNPGQFCPHKWIRNPLLLWADGLIPIRNPALGKD